MPDSMQRPGDMTLGKNKLDAMLAAAYKAGQQSGTKEREVEVMPVFQKNSKGQAEYASITLQLDHLSGPAENGHFNTKMVLSTEDTETALRSLFDYFGERERLCGLNSTLDMLVENRMSPNRGVFLYIVPSEVKDRFGNLMVQVVMSTDLFAALTKHPAFGDGSEFLLLQALTEKFSQVLQDINKARGGQFPPLSYISFEGAFTSAQESAA